MTRFFPWLMPPSHSFSGEQDIIPTPEPFRPYQQFLPDYNDQTPTVNELQFDFSGLAPTQIPDIMGQITQFLPDISTSGNVTTAPNIYGF